MNTPKELYYNFCADRLVDKNYPDAVRYVRYDLVDAEIKELRKQVAEMKNIIDNMRLPF